MRQVWGGFEAVVEFMGRKVNLVAVRCVGPAKAFECHSTLSFEVR